MSNLLATFASGYEQKTTRKVGRPVILTAFAGISLYDHTDQVVEEKKKRKNEYDTSRCNALFGNSRFDSHFGLCEVWQT